MNHNPYASGNVPSEPPKQKKRHKFFLLWQLLLPLALVALLVALFLPATRTAGPASRRFQCHSNLKQIALALQNYADVWHALPPAYTVDADGNPLHSWRTLILPYLEETHLYSTIDLSKPWNDPANAAAYDTSIFLYHCPATNHPDTYTTYMAIIAPGACFRREPRLLTEITNTPGETMMIIEVSPAHGVHWMSPHDADENRVLSFGMESTLPHTGGLHGLFVDGSVRFIPAQTSVAELRDWISISGKGD